MKILEFENLKMKLGLRKEQKYLLAVSGGIDSMVLCDLFVKNNLSFSVAHCNFQLRGEESKQDEAFVADWCKQHEIPFYAKRFDTKTYAEANKLSIQVAARNLRYAFFYETLKTEALDTLVTAHHQDDAIETTLFHFFRGSGIAGLKGIPSENNQTIRPLLNFNKEEIIAYATTHHIAYREDSSNLKQDYTRNKLRNSIIPQLEELFPQFKNNIAENIKRFEEANEVYTQQIETYRKKLIEKRGSDYYIPILKLIHVKPILTVLFELIKPYGFNISQTRQTILLLHSESGHFIENDRYRILKNRDFLILSEKDTKASEIILIENNTHQLTTAHFELRISSIAKESFHLQKDHCLCQIDESLLEYPLILRKYRVGDYMYPLGMKKKKKIARILIDQKVSAVDKEKIWVVESNKKIVWLVGIRIDERFKVVPNTQQIKILQLKK